MDNEVKGEGNSINYKYRMHSLSRFYGNPRVGRFFAVDPLAPDYPWNSPYAFSENIVIDAVELEGLEKIKTNDGEVLGVIDENDSVTWTVDVKSGTKEAKLITKSIKVVNQINSEISENTENKPATVVSEYLNNSDVKNKIKISSLIQRDLFNANQEYSSKSKFSIGTSSFWTDGPSHFTAKDLGDGKIAFYLPDNDMFVLMVGFRAKGIKFKNKINLNYFRSLEALKAEARKISIINEALNRYSSDEDSSNEYSSNEEDTNKSHLKVSSSNDTILHLEKRSYCEVSFRPRIKMVSIVDVKTKKHRVQQTKDSMEHMNKLRDQGKIGN